MKRNARRFLPLLIAALSLGLFFTGCATVPRHFEREASFALEHTHATALGKIGESPASGHPGLSGFSLLNEGRSAFLARMALAGMAERSLDVQYFILQPDMTGSILVAHLIEAARRGVRVRLLIDDLNAGGYEFGLRALDACPNIEVRLYNPFGKHLMSKLGRGLEFVGSFNRLNHRMHNKLFIADNQVALIGGRNIADSYFGADPAYNFRDFDFFSVGPVVRDFSASFDEYWNSAWAIPIRAMYSSRPSASEIAGSFSKLKVHIAAHPEYPYKSPAGHSEKLEILNRFRDQLVWAEAKVAADSPGKNKEPRSHRITAMLKEFLGNARREVLIVTPYLVPSDSGALREMLANLRSRGIATCMLTNSLGSTDLVSAHAGYAKYREVLVEGGVELHEMRPDAESRALYIAGGGPASVMGLHGKAAVVDCAFVFIGTFNFDQRSANINTEVGVLVHSPELAQKLASAVAIDLQGQNSWRVGLASECDPGLKDRKETRDLAWIAEEEGRRTVVTHEPGSSRGRLLLRSLMGLIPIDSQL
ncbi:MAG: phospholipase D family protein [Syntrophobacter sp.]